MSARGLLRRPAIAGADDGRVVAAAAVGSLLVAVVWTLIAYFASPLLGIAAIAGVVAITAVAWQPMSGVYLGLLAVPLERLGFASGGSAVTPAKALFLVTGIIVFGRLLFATERRSSHPAFGAFGCLLVVMALGLLITPDSFTTLKIVVQWAAYLAMAMYVAHSGEQQLRRLSACLAVSGAILGAITLVTAKPQSVSGGGQAATNRAEASFEHPALLAFFLVLTLGPTIALAFKARPIARGLLLAAAALITAGILLSLTRGAILGAIVALLLLLLWAPFRRLAGGLVLLALIFGAVNFSTLQHSTEVQVIGARLQSVTNTQASSSNQRVLIWAKTPAIIAQHPFLGIGAGAFPTVSPSYGIVDVGGIPFDHAHDIFLTIGAEEGLLGLALFIAFIGALATTAVRLVARHKSAPQFPFALGFAASLAGILVCGITDYPPVMLVLMAVMMLGVGAFVAASRLARENAASEQAFGRDEPAVRSSSAGLA